VVTTDPPRSVLRRSWSSSQPVDQPQYFLEQFSRHRDLGHLEDGIAGVAHDLGDVIGVGPEGPHEDTFKQLSKSTIWLRSDEEQQAFWPFFTESIRDPELAQELCTFAASERRFAN